MNTPTLETARLILRKFTENDVKSLYTIHSDFGANQFLPWFPLESIKEEKHFLKKDM